MHRLVLYLFALLTTISAQIVEADSLFIQGNTLMDNQTYRQAVSLYEKILHKGFEHADLYHNLGNAYFRMGIYGQAVWAYEKGLQINPRDQDLMYNLDITNTRVRDRIEIPNTILLLDIYRSLKKMFTLRDMLSIGSILLIIVGMLFVINSLNWISIPLFSKFVGFILVLSVIVHGIALDKYFALSDVKNGVIIIREVNIYPGPFLRDDAVLFRIHEGVKLEIIQKQTNWMEIVLLDGKKGWIESGAVRVL